MVADDGGAARTTAGAQPRVERSLPPSLPLLERDAELERDAKRAENKLCEQIATLEGDRLLKLHDEAGANVAYRIAGLLRIRRDAHLEPF